MSRILLSEFVRNSFLNFAPLSPQKHKSCLDTEGWTKPHSGIALNVMYHVPSTKPYKPGKLIYYTAIETTRKFFTSKLPSLPFASNN